MTAMTDPRRRGCCYDCGRRYGDAYGFPDLVIPDDAWVQISPSGDEGGLLCPSCICRRLHDAGIYTTGVFRSGPLGDHREEVRRISAAERTRRWREANPGRHAAYMRGYMQKKRAKAPEEVR